MGSLDDDWNSAKASHRRCKQAAVELVGVQDSHPSTSQDAGQPKGRRELMWLVKLQRDYFR
jgi:hypothetical protein